MSLAASLLSVIYFRVRYEDVAIQLGAWYVSAEQNRAPQPLITPGVIQRNYSVISETCRM